MTPWIYARKNVGACTIGEPCVRLTARLTVSVACRAATNASHTMARSTCRIRPTRLAVQRQECTEVLVIAGCPTRLVAGDITTNSRSNKEVDGWRTLTIHVRTPAIHTTTGLDSTAVIVPQCDITEGTTWLY